VGSQVGRGNTAQKTADAQKAAKLKAGKDPVLRKRQRTVVEQPVPSQPPIEILVPWSKLDDPAVAAWPIPPLS